MSIFGLNEELIIPYHSLYIDHHLFNHPPYSSLHFILIHISNLCLHNGTYINIYIHPLLLLCLLHICDNR